MILSYFKVSKKILISVTSLFLSLFFLDRKHGVRNWEKQSLTHSLLRSIRSTFLHHHLSQSLILSYSLSHTLSLFLSFVHPSPCIDSSFSKQRPLDTCTCYTKRDIWFCILIDYVVSSYNLLSGNQFFRSFSLSWFFSSSLFLSFSLFLPFNHRLIETTETFQGQKTLETLAWNAVYPL